MPHFRVMASSRVDLPEPFSPTKKATGFLNLSSGVSLRTGMLNGVAVDSDLYEMHPGLSF
jgi:hypothetical protein